MSGEGKVVCVTGASGYIASWLVKLLLQRGYTVKATVRDPNDPKKAEHLLALEGAKERLQLFKGNLLEEGSFDAAVEGCEAVFHTASPFFNDVNDPQAELLDPALKGTLNVLNSCAKVPSIKRVVLTSSMAAVIGNDKTLTPEVMVDESWFSDPDFCEKSKMWYVLSKTLAEDAAWKFVKEKGIDMVTINPAMVIGPLIQPTLNTSAAAIAQFFSDDPKKVDHLLALDGAKERLQLFKGNLLEEGSFDAAVESCEGVFHTASPVSLDVKDPQAELIDPAVKGTLNLLNSCAKVPSIKRVVLTSSMATVAYNRKPKTPEVVVDESWYADPDFNKEMKMWYILSKILAEDAAWKFVKEKNIEMVTINPALVLGPLLQPTLNISAGVIANLINGPKTYPNMVVGCVHVKDVATAHIQAFEIPSANGRYCLVETVVHFEEIVKVLKELYPNIALPEKCANDMPLERTYQVSKEKTKCLGIMEYIPLKISIKETVESLQEKGFINF